MYLARPVLPTIVPLGSKSARRPFQGVLGQWRWMRSVAQAEISFRRIHFWAAILNTNLAGQTSETSKLEQQMLREKHGNTYIVRFCRRDAAIQHAGGTIGLQGSIKQQRLIRQARPSPNLLASTVVRTSRCSWPIKRIWLHYTTASSLRKQRMRCRKTVYPFWMWTELDAAGVTSLSIRSLQGALGGPECYFQDVPIDACPHMTGIRSALLCALHNHQRIELH